MIDSVCRIKKSPFIEFGNFSSSKTLVDGIKEIGHPIPARSEIERKPIFWSTFVLTRAFSLNINVIKNEIDRNQKTTKLDYYLEKTIFDIVLTFVGIHSVVHV